MNRRSRKRFGVMAVAVAFGCGLWLVAAPPPAGAITDPLVLADSWGGTGTGDGQFNGAMGIAVAPDTGEVYVVDQGNDRIQVFDADGNYVTQFGSTGSGDGQFADPTDVAYWPFNDGWVVTDTGNDRVSLWSEVLEYDRAYGATGTGNGEFQGPHSVAAGGNLDLLYVADEGNDRVQVFDYGPDTAGAYFTQFGTNGTGNGQFDGPRGLAVNGPDVVVADSGNDRIQTFSVSGGFASSFGSAGTAAGQLSSPRGITLETATGDILAVDDQARVQAFEFDGQAITQWTLAGAPNDVALGPDGSVYVTRGDTVERYVPAPRPDARIRLGNGALTANDLYNATAVGQGRSANVGNLGTATFTVQTRNDGTVAEDIRVKGLGSTNRFTVTYKNGATIVTNQVVAGTFTYADVAPGATRNLTVVIRARPGTPPNATITRKVTVTSQTLTTVKDTVKATVTRR